MDVNSSQDKKTQKGIGGKLLLVAFIFLVVGLFYAFELHQYLTLQSLKENRDSLGRFYESNQLLMIFAYSAIYVFSTALSLPGAAILTLAGGALFGFWMGLLVVSFSSTIGATCAFLIARFLFRESVQQKFSARLKTINEGIQKEGAFYLFALRLVPIFPFFVINLVMGLTPLKTSTFFFVSQAGMLLGTAAYVNAGTQLADISKLSEILSFDILLSFAILGMIPLIAKRIVNFMKGRRALKSFKKPKSFDYNMIVIGAGSAGLVSAYIAAAVKAKVALIEKNKMGGDCLNTGCVPSKALLKTAKVISQMRNASKYGVKKTDFELDFAEVMERVQKVIKQIEPHDSIERYTNLGVDCFEGSAEIVDPYRIKFKEKILTTKNIIIATGASPFVPPISGLKETGFLTSDTIWSIRELPKRLVVLGGGPIGSELSQAFQNLGSQVTQIEMGDRIMAKEDPEVSEFMKKRFESEGVDVRVGHKAKAFEKSGSEKKVICETSDGKDVEINCDQILVAVGRKANVTGFAAEKLGIRLSDAKTIQADEFLRTNFPNIYVCGDVTGPFQFTHTASHQAWFTAVNALFSPLKKFKVDYSVIPWATFTDPEVAHVGLSETEAKEKDIAYEVTTYGIDDLDRAITESENKGFVKVLTPPGKDKILGATIVGAHAGEMIAEYVAAMKHGFGLNKILGTIHIYPTFSEANKFAAGNWKKAHAPEKALKWLEKFHRFRRKA
jgi:dihydrolipoamide dehydrogenase